MEGSERKKESKVCHICGDSGFKEHIATCCGCKRASKHIYCMDLIENLPFAVPDIWYCEECLQDAPNGSMKNMKTNGSKKVLGTPNAHIMCHRASKVEPKVKFISPEEIASTSCARPCRKWGNFGASWLQKNKRNATPPPISRMKVNESRKRAVDEGLAGESLTSPIRKATKEGFVDAGVNRPAKEYTSNMESKCVDPGLDSRCKEKPKSSKSSGTIVDSGPQFKASDFQEPGHPLALLMNPSEKVLNCPTPGSCWKGTFEVFDGVYHMYGGIQAHFPREVSPKAYEISKTLPGNLKLKILDRLNSWPTIFQVDIPSYDDIGLYFFPGECERSKEGYIHLMEQIEACDFAMQTAIDDVELLIYTSNQLTADSQRIDGQTFLWGTFCHRRENKSSEHKLEKSLCSNAADTKTSCQIATLSEVNNNDVDMEIDMIGGKEIGLVDIALTNCDAPPGFQRPTLNNNCHVRRSLVKQP